MLNALAEAEHSVVPVVRNKSVRGEREGVSANGVSMKVGTGYKA